MKLNSSKSYIYFTPLLVLLFFVVVGLLLFLYFIVKIRTNAVKINSNSDENINPKPLSKKENIKKAVEEETHKTHDDTEMSSECLVLYNCNI